MKRGLSAISVSILMLIGVSCGGSSDSGSEKVFTPEELEVALLTAEDFGDDWSVDMSGVFPSRAEGPPIFFPTAWCPESLTDVDGLAELDSIAADSGVDAEISQTRKERRSFSGVSQQLWSNDQAERFIEVIDNAMKFCDGQSWNPGGEEADEVSIEYLGNAKIGDSSTSGIMTALTPGPDGLYVWKSRTVVVRMGTIVMVLRELDVQIEDSEPFYNDAMWDDLVEMAVAKVMALQPE
jgi:hypothetical protein